MTTSTIDTNRAGRREWIGLAVLALACVLYVMDLTVLHLAVPALSHSLHPSSAQLLWIIDIYGFLVAGSLITMGSLGDRIGRRRLLLIGATAFGIASLLAAFAPTAEALIAARAVMGVAGATLAPSTLSLLRSMFHDPRQRQRAIGVWIASFSAGSAIGPVLGGIVLEHFWWGAVFLLNVPVMVALLILGPTLLPEYRDPAGGRTDLVSAALSLTAVLAVVYGLKLLAQNGVSAQPGVALAIGVGAGWWFVRRQRRLADPLIDLGLFRAPGFAAAVAIYGLGIFVVFGGALYLPQYLQLSLGMSPMVAGLWTVPAAAAMVVGSNLVPSLLRRVAPATAIGVGLVVAAAGFLLLLSVHETSGLAQLMIGETVFSLGLSPLFTLTNDLIIGTAPAERAGAAAGISETAAEVGGALGIAVLGSIGVAIYRAGVESALPSTLAAADQETARGTLAGALDVAARLDAGAGAALTDAARAVFLSGLHVAAGISAALSIALAVVVLLGRR